MKLIQSIKDIPRFKKPVVAIGVFDGVHLGHKKILKALVKRARRIKGRSVVISFHPHPFKVLYPKKIPPLLVSLEHRIRLIAETGVDALLLLRFTRAFGRLKAEDFVKNFLVGKVGVKELFMGRGFVFGRDRRGTGAFLRELGSRFGFKVVEIPIERSFGLLISSTRIRRLITMGNLGWASRLLGRPVSILGTVKRGDKRGRILGYPTANIDPHHEAIPPSGVYAVSVKYKKKAYKGVLNIGKRPTFYRYSEPTIEAHIFNFKKQIYGKELQIEFVERIREEKKFPNKQALIKQIKLDEKKAKTI